MDGARLCGLWTTVAGSAVTAALAGSERKLEFTIEDARVEGDRVIFRTGHNPLMAEFRLVGVSEAIVSASWEHLPDHLKRPETLRSIEAHRVRLVRQATSIR